MSFRLFYILLIFAAVKCGEGIWAQEEGLASYYRASYVSFWYFFKSHELGEYEKYHCMRNGSWTSL